MADLTTHYKEISPLQTVENVKHFFESNGFTLKMLDTRNTEADTWFCRIELYKDDIKLGAANGKGMTKEYCLASCYAELYERFCNADFFIDNHNWIKNAMLTKKKENGYFFRPDEVLLSYEEGISSCNRIRRYLSKVTNNDPKLRKEFLDYVLEGQYVGVPFVNIDDPTDILYADHRLIRRTTTSAGLSAGNTLDEALVQALSELVELEGKHSFFKDINITRYAIKLENIQNDNLQNIIHHIQDCGYQLYLIDLSYNYGFPVIMSLLVDRDKGNLNINFGAFPVFDIAAERSLTELYQGVLTYRDSRLCGRTQTPYRTIELEDVYSIYGGYISGEIFPMEFFDNIQYVDNYNTEIFVNKNATNSELVKYFANLANKRNQFKFYYIDNSLDPSIKAIQVLLETTDDNYSCYCIEDLMKFKWKDDYIEDAIKYQYILKFINDQLYHKKEFNSEILIETINVYYELSETVRNYVKGLTSNHLYYVVHRTEKEKWSVFFPFIYPYGGDNLMINLDLIDSEYYKNYKKYGTLMRYLKTEKYSEADLFNIFNTIFNYNITIEDIQNGLDPKYLLKKVFIDSAIEFSQSQGYAGLINTYLKI